MGKHSHTEDTQDLIQDLKEDYDSSWYKRMLSAPVDNDKLPIAAKVFAVLCMLASVYGIVEVVLATIDTVNLFVGGKLERIGLSSVIVTFVQLLDLILLAASFLIFAIRLFRNQRRYAAVVLYAVYALLIVGGLCSLMLYGVSPRLIIYIVLLAFLIAFQVYLDPSLREERHLQRMLHDKEIKKEQEKGILGRDPSGKGFLELNFFNLFWLFVVASFLGDVMESIFHVVVVDPGHWQDRAGLLFGPFSPIYGCGALLMTLFLNRLYKKNVIIIFLASAIIGGAFEYFVSVFMQYTFGAVAWNYTGQFLSIGGRTCGLAMAAWGLLGVLWIKLLLPGLLKLVDLIPWNWRYSVTVVAALFMAADCIMSLQALDCWYERLANDPVNSPIQKFYSEYFDNSFMENRFQSMTIHADDSVRSAK